MNHTKRLNRIFGRLAYGLLALSLATAPAWADVIETKNGARLVGKVVKVDGAVVSLETDYAGVISVKLSEVASVRTDAPLNYRLAGGTVLQGTLASTDGGQVKISGSEGAVTTPLDKIAATWAPGAPDPAVVAMQRAWAYEVAMDLTGKSGNRDQTGTAASFRAVLAGPQDTLQFYAAYDRQETDGQKSADQFRAGVDYQNNFSGKRSWYVRNEGGFDRIKDVDLYNVAAAGLGLDFIKEAKQTLTGRAGVSFRYEGYKNPRTEDVRSAGLDFGLNHRLEMETSVLVNRLSFVPAFEDFGNYRAIHESFLELPTVNPRWKLRIGLLNDYNSEPGSGVEEMDTTYFARLVLNWK